MERHADASASGTTMKITAIEHEQFNQVHSRECLRKLHLGFWWSLNGEWSFSSWESLSLIEVEIYPEGSFLSNRLGLVLKDSQTYQTDIYIYKMLGWPKNPFGFFITLYRKTWRNFSTIPTNICILHVYKLIILFLYFRSQLIYIWLAYISEKGR